MNKKERRVTELIAECEKYGLGGIDYVKSLPFDLVVKAYNGLGPSWFPSPLRKAIDKLDPVLKPIALPHDCRFSYGDGSKRWFDMANDELEANGLKIANFRYKWYNPWRYVVRSRARAYAATCRTFGWLAYEGSMKLNNPRF